MKKLSYCNENSEKRQRGILIGFSLPGVVRGRVIVKFPMDPIYSLDFCQISFYLLSQ